MYVEMNSDEMLPNQGGRNPMQNQIELIDKAGFSGDPGISILVSATENHFNF